MFKLYYTGATTYREMQPTIINSIGGYISDTAIPNGTINSLFSDIGALKIWDKKPIVQYIGVYGNFFFFEGETAQDFMNLRITLHDNSEEKYPGLFTYRVGIGPIGGDEIKGLYMEQLSRNTSKPYYLKTDFQELKDGVPLLFENNNVATGMGIWFERKYNPLAIQSTFDTDSIYWDTHDILPTFDINLTLDLVVEIPT